MPEIMRFVTLFRCNLQRK